MIPAEKPSRETEEHDETDEPEAPTALEEPLAPGDLNGQPV